jgi:Zinc finger, C2H2 type
MDHSIAAFALDGLEATSTWEAPCGISGEEVVNGALEFDAIFPTSGDPALLGNSSISLSNAQPSFESLNELLVPVLQSEGAESSTSKPFQCPLCFRAYVQKGKLKAHYLKDHFEEHPEMILEFPGKISKYGKAHPCPIEDCDSGFSQVCSLNRHLKTSHPIYWKGKESIAMNGYVVKSQQ